MNPDDEVTPWFTEFGEQATVANTPTAPRRHRVPALVAGAVAVAVLAAGGTWLALHRNGSAGSGSGAPGQGAGSPAGSATGSPAGSATGSPAGSPADSATATPSDDGAQAAAGLPRCHTSDLAGRLDGSAGGGAAGSVYLDLGLTNRSSHSCQIYGFPGMTLIDAGGRWIPTTVRRDSTPPRLFTLASGQTAWAVVHYAHIPADDESAPCQPAAVGLAVTPPDETTQLTIQAKLNDVCQHAQLTTSVLTDKRPG